jgi:beta-lactamase regulating signal transducer with metallopeptidase domain
MIAVWMAYATVVAACAGATAAALEPIFGSRRLPRRWLWATAMMLALLTPAAVAVRPMPSRTGLEGMATGELLAGTAAVAPISPMLDSHTVDLALLALWGAASLFVLGSVSLGARQLRRAQATAQRALLDGEVVAITGDLGPGATPFGSPRILIPAWVGLLDRQAARLLVSHEREHLRASDPALLLSAVGALVVMPWNPALWWCVRRLRAALEIDCDARVLARENDVRSYGELLLDVAGRRGRQPLAAFLTFADSSTPLERRIAAMTEIRRPLSRVRLATLGSLALLAIIVACETRRPAPLAPVTDYVLEDGGTTARRTQQGPIIAAGQQRARFALNAAIEKFFPGLATNGGTDKPIIFVVDDGNTVVWAKIAEHAANGAAATPGEIPYSKESIETVEVLKRGDMLPPGVRGGVILVSLKGSTPRGGAPSESTGLRTFGRRERTEPNPASLSVPDSGSLAVRARSGRPRDARPDAPFTDALVTILDADGRVLFSERVGRSLAGGPMGGIPVERESIASVDVRNSSELSPTGASSKTIRIVLKPGAGLSKVK